MALSQENGFDRFSTTRQRLDGYFEHLNLLNTVFTGSAINEGITCPKWSDHETAVHNYLSGRAREAGFDKVEVDEVGNTYLTLTGKSPECVLFCSHVDSVRCGGEHDGRDGIIIGIEAARVLRQKYGELPFSIKVVIFRGEESAYFRSPYTGSLAAAGRLSAEILDRKEDDVTLEQRIVSQGFSTESIRARRPIITKEFADNILTAFEFHCEQASSLATQRAAVGLATSIRGACRFWIEVFGITSHSGAEPMQTRADANRTYFKLMQKIEEIYETIAKDADLVFASTAIQVPDRARAVGQRVNIGQTSVSPYLNSLIDARSADPEVTASFFAQIRAAANSLEKDGLRINLTPVSQSEPIRTDEIANASLAEAINLHFSQDKQKKAIMNMPCGAGHDITVIQRLTRSEGLGQVPVGLFLIRNFFGSHNPDETVLTDDLLTAIEIAAEATYRAGIDGLSIRSLSTI